MKKFVVIILILSALRISAQTNVIPVSSENAPQNSITYFLPQTEIFVSVTVKKTIEKRGQFANYAKRLLALNNVAASNKESYEIDNVYISHNFIADSTKKYAIEINPKSVAYKVKLNENGVIESVNWSEKEDLPINLPSMLSDCASHHNYLDTIFNFSVLGEEALLATSEAKMAELVAKQIFKIRESKMEILSGESEKEFDGEALALAISELDKIEKELIVLFSGKTATAYERKTFRIIPKTAVENQVLFRFSPLLGVVETDNFAGRPVVVNIAPKFIYKENLAPPQKTIKQFGLFYNVVGSAEISVIDNEKILTETTITMPQFGITKFLPAEIFNKPETQMKFTKFGTVEYIK
ncbi:MAG: DUF4831 family protein [Prevotellaceae bacterium]|jgi:hypothetical protein|nr:DUF4831 family protein [Prevotellaceae bacterium]